MEMQKILKLREHGSEDIVYIIPDDISNETTINLLKDFIENTDHDLPDLSEVYLVDDGDFIDLDEYGCPIIAEIDYAYIVD